MATTVQKMQMFTSSGVFNVPAGVEGVWVTMIGGGGGGGASWQQQNGTGSLGAGSGEFCSRMPIKVTPSSAVTVTIGAGGPSAQAISLILGTAGFPTSFNGFAVMGGATGATNVGAGAGGATTTSGLGRPESPSHFGGSNRSSGGRLLPLPRLPGWTGATGPGYGGGVGGPPDSGYTGFGGSGGGGGASTMFGQGGIGGNGGGGGSATGGGVPPSTNGSGPIFDPINFPYKWPYGAGGGGAGGSPAGAGPVWGGAGAPGLCIVEWYEEVP